jgi:uroporphyrinogen-III decarboxylase
MTPLQRLSATIKGEPTDRIPIFCNLLDQGAKQLGMSLREYYSKGAHVAEGQLLLRERYGYDNVWSLFYVGKEAELLGCRKILFADDGPPNVEDFVIQKPEDIEKLEVPDDVAGHPAFAETAECLRILKAEVGGKVPICAYVTGSMTLPALLMGMDKWMSLLMNGPVDLRDLLLAKCSTFFRREIAAFRAAGADVLLYSNPFGSTYFVGMKRFQEVSLPWMERDLLPEGVDGVVYYCGSAPFNNVLARVIDRLGIQAFYLGPDDDVAEGKRIVAGRGLTCGVINDIKLLSWSPEEIRSEVRRIIEAGKAGGKFLFGTVLMPYNIAEESIRVMLEAAEEYGRFDGSGVT